jgi:hypothetical protein
MSNGAIGMNDLKGVTHLRYESSIRPRVLRHEIFALVAVALIASAPELAPGPLAVGAGAGPESVGTAAVHDAAHAHALPSSGAITQQSLEAFDWAFRFASAIASEPRSRLASKCWSAVRFPRILGYMASALVL